jgi:hypothetical protein
MKIVQLVIFIFIILPIFWYFLLYSLAKIGGWTELEKRFSSNKNINGEIHRFASACINKIQYNMAFTLIVSNNGILLHPVLFFRFTHSSIFIPFSEITKCVLASHRFRKCAEIHIKNSKIIIRLYSNAENYVIPAYENSLK